MEGERERGKEERKGESWREGGQMEIVLGGCAEVEYGHVLTTTYPKTFILSCR